MNKELKELKCNSNLTYKNPHNNLIQVTKYYNNEIKGIKCQGDLLKSHPTNLSYKQMLEYGIHLPALKILTVIPILDIIKPILVRSQYMILFSLLYCFIIIYCLKIWYTFKKKIDYREYQK